LEKSEYYAPSDMI